jgi:hypothetical protein
VNVSSRSVWVPPGGWIDAWSGATITGPKTVTVSQPVERIPLWHKKGGLTILASEPTLRVDDQDWSELTLEAFPHAAGTAGPDCVTVRTLVDRLSEARTTVTMTTDTATNQLSFAVTAAEDGAARGWVLRVHLAPGGQRVASVNADGVDLGVATVVHLSPVAHSDADNFSPFGGKGARPAPEEGYIAEVILTSGSAPRTVRLQLE